MSDLIGTRLKRFAAVEGGGTSWTAAIMEGSPENIVDRANFHTDTPNNTIPKIKEWLMSKEFDSLGIASFGPVDAKPTSPTYGYITSTPKPGWKNTDVLGLIGVKDVFSHIPYIFDTDVNAPALAQYHLHLQTLAEDETASRRISSCAYITVGTGVGVGLVINGETVHGLLHPEAGHVYVRRADSDADFPGTCPYHGCCLEGMVSSGALAARKSCAASALASLPDEDEVWDLWAYYVAQLCVNLVLIASPERIVIGGGVLNRPSLLPRVRQHFLSLMNGYVVHEMLSSGIDSFITTPFGGSDAGIIGAAYLAMIALQGASR